MTLFSEKYAYILQIHTWFDAQLDQKILDGIYHPYITSAKGLGGSWVGSEKWQFLLVFSPIYANVSRFGWLRKRP